MLGYKKNLIAGNSVNHLYSMSPFSDKRIDNWKSLIALLQSKVELKDWYLDLILANDVSFIWVVWHIRVFLCVYGNSTLAFRSCFHRKCSIWEFNGLSSNFLLCQPSSKTGSKYISRRRKTTVILNLQTSFRYV